MSENNLKILTQELRDPIYAGKTADEVFGFTMLRSVRFFTSRFTGQRCDALRRTVGIKPHAEHDFTKDGPQEAGFPNAITREEFDAAWAGR